MIKGTIAAGYAKALVEMAVSRGANRSELLAQAQIKPNELTDQDQRVLLASYLALLEAAQKLLDEPALSLQFGQAFSMPELSIVGLIGQASATVGEAFAQMNRFRRLMLDEGEGSAADWFEFTEDQQGAWLVLTNSIYRQHPVLAESAFARAVAGSTREPGSQSFASAVHFIHEAPSYRSEYERVFQIPVVFGSDRNALRVDRDFLAKPIPSGNRYAFGVLSQRAEQLLQSLEGATTVKAQVERLLIPVLHTGELKMEPIARELGLSRRTLSRRLNAEGISYRSLLDELRQQMARHYLNDQKVSITETAYLLGFSDATAFSRAFKRWTGDSPSAAREQPG